MSGLVRRAKEAVSILRGAGLSVYVSAFKLSDAAGAKLACAGQSVAVPANTTVYLMLDLQSLLVHALRYPHHTGGVLLAVVVTAAASVTSIDKVQAPRVPATRIPKFKAKMRAAGATLRIGKCGDSLTEQAGTGTQWFDKVFTAAASAFGYFYNPDSGLSTLDNFATGGQTSLLGLVLAGRGVHSYSVDYDNTAITQGAHYSARNFLGAADTSDSRLFGYDLVTLCFGANGGTDSLALIEATVRILRNRGVEVVLMTSNPKVSDPTFQGANVPILARMAEQYGCAFVDEWSYMREAMDNGVSIHSDDIHNNEAGSSLRAQAVRSVINDLAQTAEAMPLPAGRALKKLSHASQTLMSKKFPNRIDFQAVPMSHTGVVAGSGATAYNNPAQTVARRTSANDVTRLTAGQSAKFGHAAWAGLTVVANLRNAFTASITRQAGGAVIGTINNAAGLGYDRFAPAEIANAGEYLVQAASIADNFPGFNNSNVTVTCNSGTLDLAGVGFLTFDSQDVPFESMVFSGTWAAENYVNYGNIASRYTDVVGDSVIIPFRGNGLQVLVPKRSASAQIEVYLDGVLYTTYWTGGGATSRDLYAAAGADLMALNIFANQTHLSAGYGEHVVVVKIIGVNGAAVAPVASNRRLSILAAYAMDAR